MPITVRIIRTESDGVVVYADHTKDPDVNDNSDDQDTIAVPENEGGVTFMSGGSGTRELRLVSSGGSCLVQVSDDS